MIEFSRVDLSDPNLDPGIRAAAEFLTKMDWEGGLTGILEYGGAAVFPTSLQNKARIAELALEDLKSDLIEWAKIRGVTY